MPLFLLASYTRSPPAPLPTCPAEYYNAKLVPRSFRAVQLLYNTVGYPRENGRWSLNYGWCTLNVFSLSGYKILVNMEPIQGNHDRREPILRKIASDSFFPNPLSPFRQGPLRLQWPEIPSRALHLLDAGTAGETYLCAT